jgi:hypothetical protein
MRERREATISAAARPSLTSASSSTSLSSRHRSGWPDEVTEVAKSPRMVRSETKGLQQLPLPLRGQNILWAVYWGTNTPFFSAKRNEKDSRISSSNFLSSFLANCSPSPDISATFSITNIVPITLPLALAFPHRHKSIPSGSLTTRGGRRRIQQFPVSRSWAGGWGRWGGRRQV